MTSKPSGQEPYNQFLPIVSIVVPFFALTDSILRILKGNPQNGTTMETIGNL